jgi:enediyne biosynthesis protein E4
MRTRHGSWISHFYGTAASRTLRSVNAAYGRLRFLVPLLVLVAVAAAAVSWYRGRSQPETTPALRGFSSNQTREMVERIAAIEAQERQIAATVWAPELLAQRCGQVVDRLWDALNAAPDPWLLLQLFSWPTVQGPAWDPPHNLEHGIQHHLPTQASHSFTAESWKTLLHAQAQQGWELARVEFRHRAFATNALGGPATSRYAVSAWLIHDGQNRRASLAGDVIVHWSGEPQPDGSYRMDHIDASQVRLLERVGPTPFVEVHFAEVTPPDRSHFIDPILIHDLNRDGIPEIILAARNQVLHPQPDDTFPSKALCAHPTGLIFTALLADLDHDGFTDFICARVDGLVLFRGTAEGTFPHPGEQVWSAPTPLRYGQVLTTADVDGDGDLDLWLGQYKTPYERGQMPTPYYAANDGYPAYLLLNDGHGRFHDATQGSGLESKRHRRTYSASFADLNDDHAPDLVVISDFAGVDLYLNDGHGRFHDVTQWLPDPVGFGMAHAFGDFDGDGLLDLIVTGMHCPAALRLDSLGLRRPGFDEFDAMRPRMTQGNRLYQRRGEGFVFTDLGRSVSDSGWSWSPAAGDYDNDGYLDLYVANGHESRQSVVDYEPEFWLSDIYIASSADDLATAAYFGGKFARTRGQGQSYGGYEANRLFLNQNGDSFLETGWLFGVAVEQDSRNAVPADLNGDGRLDLVVTTFEAWPRVRQTVRIFRNQIAQTGHWIGVRLEPNTAVHPFGALITAEAGTRRWARSITSGDLHRAQQPWTVHFGLGSVPRLDRLRVLWPNGASTDIADPELDRYHMASPPLLPTASRP